ncbi:MAG: hypothetical protein KDI36_12255 [Pseudomonadales bacterium]|nr:hypothetical protein [Pseudomonadales bacterium]
MIETLKNSVNHWETDENDHLNVRFYVRRMMQTLRLGLRDLGLTAALDEQALLRGLQTQHMRFVREARIAAPVSGWMGVLSASGEPLQILTELRHTGTGEVMAAFVHDFSTQVNHQLQTDPLPAHAGSRGIAAAPVPYARLSLEEALDKGFHRIGRALADPAECDTEGYLEPEHFMGNFSNSMPNLWAHFSPAGDAVERGVTEGGAVLEYRMNYLAPLRAGEGFEIVSGVSELADKTQRFVHLLFNLNTGECCVASEAMAITMDLVARKAISIPAARRQVMEKLLLAPL